MTVERGRRPPRRQIRREERPDRQEVMRIEARRGVRVAPDKVFAILAKVESLPRYSRLWSVADYLERRQQTLRLRGYFCGLPVESTVRISIRPPRVEFRQSHGSFRELRGSLAVVAAAEGSEVTYVLEADPAIPMIDERTARLALGQDVEATLDKVKTVAERPLREREIRRTRMRAKAQGEVALPAAQEIVEAEPTPVEPAEPQPAGQKRRRRRRRRRAQ